MTNGKPLAFFMLQKKARFIIIIMHVITDHISFVSHPQEPSKVTLRDAQLQAVQGLRDLNGLFYFCMLNYSLNISSLIFIMKPAKKIHYKYGCDRRLERNNWGDLLHHVTDDLQKVDCKHCLKIIQNKKLRSRSSFPDVLTFDVVAHGYWKHEGKEAQCYLTFTCPVCGQVNVHGGYYGKIGAADGPRTSPCNCWEKDYYIREVKAID